MIRFHFFDFENEIGFRIIRDFRENVSDLHGVIGVNFNFAIFGFGGFADFPEQGASLELDELRDIDV